MNKKNGKKKLVLELMLVIGLLILVWGILFNDRSTTPEAIWESIRSADYRYFGAAIGALILYFVIYYSSMQLICHFSNVKAKARDIFLISNSEFFFNGITPGAVGGQPFQVFAFKQIGVTAGQSTGVILMNFVCGMVSQFILAGISFSCYDKVIKYAPSMIPLFWIGMLLQAFVVLFFIFLGFSKVFRKVTIKLVDWIASWRILRRFKNISSNFEGYITNAQLAFTKCWEHKRVFLIGTLLKLLSYICLYTIPFFIFKAVKMPLDQVNSSKIYLIVCVTSIASISANFIPTPGASGVIESTFKNYLGPIVIFEGAVATVQMNADVTAATLLWRIVTYYLLMLFSFICYTIFTHSLQARTGDKNDIKSEDLNDIPSDKDNVSDDHKDDNLQEPLELDTNKLSE